MKADEANVGDHGVVDELPLNAERLVATGSDYSDRRRCRGCWVLNTSCVACNLEMAPNYPVISVD